jgi:2-dehydro-3-deoxy-D-arabinonate dehydratase
MHLTKHRTTAGWRWAADGHYLSHMASLGLLMSVDARRLPGLIASLLTGERVTGERIAPVDAGTEVWACGVTYLRSRDARMAESTQASVYDRVYAAERPEVFFKSVGWRVRGSGENIHVRADSTWDVPEPELTLVVNAHGEIVGYTAGNDVSSRSIEGENPLYLPQAKSYNGSCAVGPAIRLCPAEAVRDLPVRCEIRRSNSVVFEGEARTSQMKRTPEELVAYLRKELDFPRGLLLMTGTCIVPGEDFTLKPGDQVEVTVGELSLMNSVQ